MTLGQRIQAGRNALELSQEGLGERLGVSRQAVSKWEADAAVPDTDKLIALSRLFGVTLNELLQVEPPAARAESVCPSGEPEAGNAAAGPAASPEKEGPSLERLLAWGLAILLAVGLVDARTRLAAQERRADRLEEWLLEGTLEGGGKDLVTGLDCVLSGDVMTLRLQTKADYKGTALFRIFSADGKETQVFGEDGVNGRYEAKADVGGMDDPFVVLAEFGDGETLRRTPLVRLYDVSPEGNSWRETTLWDR